MGRRYNRRKGKREDNLKQNVPKGKSCTSGSTADAIASEHGVSPRTVKNAGQFASAVEEVQATRPDVVAEGRQASPRDAISCESGPWHVEEVQAAWGRFF